MRNLALAVTYVALTACQPSAEPTSEAATNTAAVEAGESVATIVETEGLIGAADVEAIVGEWSARSQGAEAEFGALNIDAGRIAFANIGTASATFEDSYASLEWEEDHEGLSGICSDGPPAAVEFRLSDKSEFLSAGTPGQVLELSFYTSAAKITDDRDTNLDLCRISTWERG